MPKLHTGFLPYIPHPITECSTVYTVLKNFLAVFSQLNQTRLPVFCDKRVYRTVADITHQKKDAFSGIILLLGGFHIAKAAQHSIGKLIKHTGLDDALVKTGAFGIKIIESVTSRSHYDRSLRGLLILEDAVEALKWKAFWKHSKEGGEKLKDQLKSIAESLESTNKDKVKIVCATKSEVIETLKDLVGTFVCIAVKNFEIYKYWEAILKDIPFLKDLIAADGTGNWVAHLQAMQNLLPLFRESDSINYLRYASLYLEQMR